MGSTNITKEKGKVLGGSRGVEKTRTSHENERGDMRRGAQRQDRKEERNPIGFPNESRCKRKRIGSGAVGRGKRSYTM